MGMLDGMVKDIIGVDLFKPIYETLNVNLFSDGSGADKFNQAALVLIKVF